MYKIFPSFKTLKIQYLQIRSFSLCPRYSGYVNYFNEEKLYGFVCRDDNPEIEYYFNISNLKSDSIPRVRTFQDIEFGIVENVDKHTAKDLTAIGGGPIYFNHPNMKLSRINRDRKLSELNNGLIERHTGVVINNFSSGDGGYIIPDTLYFEIVRFKNHEIQATGKQRILPMTQVEFNVRPPKMNTRPMDYAVCITRKNGGLITAERGKTGTRRRILGATYDLNDTIAQVPTEFQHKRQLGYIVRYVPENCHGFILPFNDPTNIIYVHVDDCHIYGPRYLNRFQCVEYVTVFNETTGKKRAMQVTGPSQTVLKSRSENMYTVESENIHVCPPDTGERLLGQVIVARHNANWIFIKPDKLYHQPLRAFKKDIRAVSGRNIKIGNVLEFEVTVPYTNQNSIDGIYDDCNGVLPNRAIKISAPNDQPVLTETGAYFAYLLSKFNLPTVQSELPEYVMCESMELLIGYIVSFREESRIGFIEIEAPEGKRYRKILFHWNDCILEDGLDQSKIFIPMTTNKICFKIEIIDDNEDRFGYQGEINWKAVDIVSENNDTLFVREFNAINYTRQIKAPIDLETIRASNTEAILDELDFLKL